MNILDKIISYVPMIVLAVLTFKVDIRSRYRFIIPATALLFIILSKFIDVDIPTNTLNIILIVQIIFTILASYLNWCIKRNHKYFKLDIEDLKATHSFFSIVFFKLIMKLFLIVSIGIAVSDFNEFTAKIGYPFDRNKFPYTYFTFFKNIDQTQREYLLRIFIGQLGIIFYKAYKEKFKTFNILKFVKLYMNVCLYKYDKNGIDTRRSILSSIFMILATIYIIYAFIWSVVN